MADEPIVTKHPSYGLLSFARASSTKGGNLFGSSIQHCNTMRLTLSEAELIRSLNHDRYHPTGRLFELEMSPTQFADLITSANAGVGVPVTIKWTREKGLTDPPPVVTKRLQFEAEFTQHIKEITRRLDQLRRMHRRN